MYPVCVADGTFIKDSKLVHNDSVEHSICTLLWKYFNLCFLYMRSFVLVNGKVLDGQRNLLIWVVSFLNVDESMK